MRTSRHFFSDADELPRGAVIGLSAGFGVLGVILAVFIAVIVILVIMMCVICKSKKADGILGKIEIKLTKIRNDLKAGGTETSGLQTDVDEVLKLHEKLQKILRIGHDGEAESVEDLKKLKASLEDILKVTNDVLGISAE